MDKAKAAISDFLSKDGKHQTTVDQDVQPAVTEEHVRPHEHEHVTTAVDREVHKDHHYTTVQPVTQKETLPEQHHHNIIPVEHKSIDHGGQAELKSALDRDAAQYQDTTTTHATTQSQSTVPVAAGERTHHHVHEHVQPVVQKEVVQPHVVHTTIPIHETHTAAPAHHGTKIAPTKTMEEFLAGGGNVEGGTTKALYDYEGCPETEESASKTGTSKTSATAGGLAGAAGTAGLAAGTTKHHETADYETSRSAPFDNAGTGDYAGEKSLGNETLATQQPTYGATGTTGTAAGTTSEHTSEKPTAKEKVISAVSGKSTSEEKHSGSMFGKDKTLSEAETQHEPHHATKTRDTNLTEENNYKPTGIAGTSSVDRVNEEGAFGGPGSVPRTEGTHTTTDPQFTPPVQSWHAGETHKNIAEDVHTAGEKHRSLLDKINPFKDSDGDGQKGFMK